MPRSNTNTQISEYATFEGALRRVLAVSKADLTRMLAEEKSANAGKPKRGPKPRSLASAHASSDEHQNERS